MNLINGPYCSFDTSKLQHQKKHEVDVNGKEKLPTAIKDWYYKAGLSQRLQWLKGTVRWLHVRRVLRRRRSARARSLRQVIRGQVGSADSAVVLENIKGKTKSPYQERLNMDEKGVTVVTEPVLTNANQLI